MDLKSLKLELLERISLMEDETRLLALKRLLDAPRGYGIPNEHLSVVKEGEEPYLKLEDRNYSAAEVRKIVDEVTDRMMNEGVDLATQLSPEEWAQLDKDRDAYLRGEGSNFTWEELKKKWAGEKR
ncbi:MAG: hypothetical protein IPN44_02070 [Flavobacteriales bacterium]|nr:hypothetical protein [Flavobacteriales bacterium]